jgi:hypothetical protein
MAKNKTIIVENFEIVLYTKEKEQFISLTDMARYRDVERTNYIIQNWMRTRNAIEFIGLWEQMNNPDFKRIEFDAFKNELVNIDLSQSERLVQLNTVAITQIKSLLNGRQIKKLKH